MRVTAYSALVVQLRHELNTFCVVKRISVRRLALSWGEPDGKTYKKAIVVQPAAACKFVIFTVVAIAILVMAVRFQQVWIFLVFTFKPNEPSGPERTPLLGNLGAPKPRLISSLARHAVTLLDAHTSRWILTSTLLSISTHLKKSQRFGSACECKLDIFCRS